MATKKDQAPAVTEVEQQSQVLDVVTVSTRAVESQSTHIWTADELRQGYLDGDAPSRPSVSSGSAQDAQTGTEVATEDGSDA